MENKISFIDILNLGDQYKNNLREWRNQDFVRQKMFNDKIISLDEHIRFLECLKENESKKIFVCFCNMEPFAILQYDVCADNSMEFGYYLINKKWIDGGFGIVLEYAILNYGFYKLKVDKIFCRTLKINTKIIALHKKFGFQSENKKILLNDEYKDICYQTILIENWKEKKESIEKIIKYFIPLKNIENL